MAWYYILFYITLIFFVVKTIITLSFGDTDIDFDADGDVDFDVSSMFSFKGILHFLFGFSTYLSLIAKFDTDVSVTGNLSWIHYVIGIIVGIIFMCGLYMLYRLMMKFNHYDINNLDVYNYPCTILINNGLSDSNNNTYSYTVLINTEAGSRKINVISDKPNLKIGGEYKIYKNNQGIYYI